MEGESATAFKALFACFTLCCTSCCVVLTLPCVGACSDVCRPAKSGLQRAALLSCYMYCLQVLQPQLPGETLARTQASLSEAGNSSSEGCWLLTMGTLGRCAYAPAPCGCAGIRRQLVTAAFVRSATFPARRAGQALLRGLCSVMVPMPCVTAAQAADQARPAILIVTVASRLQQVPDGVVKQHGSKHSMQV